MKKYGHTLLHPTKPYHQYYIHSTSRKTDLYIYPINFLLVNTLTHFLLGATSPSPQRQRMGKANPGDDESYPILTTAPYWSESWAITRPCFTAFWFCYHFLLASTLPYLTQYFHLAWIIIPLVIWAKTAFLWFLLITTPLLASLLFSQFFFVIPITFNALKYHLRSDTILSVHRISLGHFGITYHMHKTVCRVVRWIPNDTGPAMGALILDDGTDRVRVLVDKRAAGFLHKDCYRPHVILKLFYRLDHNNDIVLHSNTTPIRFASPSGEEISMTDSTTPTYLQYVLTPHWKECAAFYQKYCTFESCFLFNPFIFIPMTASDLHTTICSNMMYSGVDISNRLVLAGGVLRAVYDGHDIVAWSDSHTAESPHGRFLHRCGPSLRKYLKAPLLVGYGVFLLKSRTPKELFLNITLGGGVQPSPKHLTIWRDATQSRAVVLTHQNHRRAHHKSTFVHHIDTNLKSGDHKESVMQQIDTLFQKFGANFFRDLNPLAPLVEKMATFNPAFSPWSSSSKKNKSTKNASTRHSSALNRLTTQIGQRVGELKQKTKLLDQLTNPDSLNKYLEEIATLEHILSEKTQQVEEHCNNLSSLDNQRYAEIDTRLDELSLIAQEQKKQFEENNATLAKLKAAIKTQLAENKGKGNGSPRVKTIPMLEDAIMSQHRAMFTEESKFWAKMTEIEAKKKKVVEQEQLLFKKQREEAMAARRQVHEEKRKHRLEIRLQQKEQKRVLLAEKKAVKAAEKQKKLAEKRAKKQRLAHIKAQRHEQRKFDYDRDCVERARRRIRSRDLITPQNLSTKPEALGAVLDLTASDQLTHIWSAAKLELFRILMDQCTTTTATTMYAESRPYYDHFLTIVTHYNTCRDTCFDNVNEYQTYLVRVSAEVIKPTFQLLKFHRKAIVAWLRVLRVALIAKKKSVANINTAKAQREYKKYFELLEQCRDVSYRL